MSQESRCCVSATTLANDNAGRASDEISGLNEDSSHALCVTPPDLQNNPMQRVLVVNLSPMLTSPRCNAMTRRKTACQAPAMANHRCRMHGGLSTGAPRKNKNAVKHGIFCRELTEEESNLFPTINLTLHSVDDELRMTHVILRRVMNAEFQSQGKPELQQIIYSIDSNDVAQYEVKYKCRDYYALFDRFLGRIESLLKTRLLLLKAEQEKRDDQVPVGFEAVEYNPHEKITSADEAVPDKPIV